jgi:predicted RNA binding protein YcfA (HicA-like mRNA interferase family)
MFDLDEKTNPFVKDNVDFRDPKAIHRHLTKNGYVPQQGGKHIVYKHSTRRIVVVPRHNYISPGVARDIMTKCNEDTLTHNGATIYVKQHPTKKDSYVVHHLDDPNNDLSDHLKKGDTEDKDTINDFANTHREQGILHKVVVMPSVSKNNKEITAQVEETKPQTGAQAHMTSKHIKTPETTEPQSLNPNDPDSRLDGTSKYLQNLKDETPGQSPKRSTLQTIKKILDEDKNGYKNPTGGLTQKGRGHYNRESGGHLKAPVTTPPSKLKAGSKAANRRKSFCARMSGVEGPMKKPNGEPTRKALALRKWNC